MSEPIEFNGRGQLLYVVLVIGGWIISGFIGYTSAASAMNARVSVLETQYQQLHVDLSDMRADIKELLARRER